MTAAAPVPVRIGRLLAATHPEPAALVTAVSGALAVATGRDAPGVLAVVAAVLAGQLSVGWCNDYVDRDRDAVAGRTDKPIVRGDVSPGAVRRAAGTALLASVPLSLLSGLAAGSLHVAAVASAWAYDLRLKATAWSVLPYAVSFGLLPVYVVLGRPGADGYPLWLPAAGALLGAAAHFANVLPDLDADLATGVRGLPHRIGAAASRVVAAVLLLAASVVLALGPPGPPGWAGAGTLAAVVLLVLGGALAARRGGSRAAFRAVLLVAAVDVALLLARGSALT